MTQGVLLLHDLLLATVLQLMAVQSLQHLTHWGIGDWGYGAIVGAAVLILSQVTLRKPVAPVATRVQTVKSNIGNAVAGRPPAVHH